jgi:hypothetical protein
VARRVAGQLQSDAASSEGEKPLLPAKQRLKDRWQENYGIELGGDYNLLGIYAMDSLGEDAAVGGVRIDLSPALAVKMSKVLGCSAENWMAMQANHTLARYRSV